MINWHAYAGNGKWEKGINPKFIENFFKTLYGIKPQCYG